MARCRIEKKPWERQDGETPKAFEAFSVYLELGTIRSVRAAAQKCSKNASLFMRWSAANKWVERAAAHDEELRRQAFEKRKQETRNMQTRQLQTAIIIQKKALEAINKMPIESMKPQDALRFFMEASRIEKELRSDMEFTEASVREETVDRPPQTEVEAMLDELKREAGVGRPPAD